jgi:hypothetical protein
MAKEPRTLPARGKRDRARDDRSLLLQSAESLARVIGALQRQLDEATRGLSNQKVRGSTRKKSAKNTHVQKSPRSRAQSSRKNPR